MPLSNNAITSHVINNTFSDAAEAVDRARVFLSGTELAIGLPRAEGHPVVLDIAMAVATRGKIGLAVAEGKPPQADWILDRLGVPLAASVVRRLTEYGDRYKLRTTLQQVPRHDT